MFVIVVTVVIFGKLYPFSEWIFLFKNYPVFLQLSKENWSNCFYHNCFSCTDINSFSLLIKFWSDFCIGDSTLFFMCFFQPRALVLKPRWLPEINVLSGSLADP